MLQLSSSAQVEGCQHVHYLLNKLSVIIGNCDLLIDSQGKPGGVNASSVRRIEAIRRVAEAMAEEAKEYACTLQSARAANLLADVVALGLSRESSTRG